ncbi:hypothetical protein [Inquilinus sp. OTU3971]|uniref:hypothetical protein n=1 Tax=Inquilinus sp. OTU3971 TaxID=3043855 RepID=UPI00313EFBD1
MSALYVMRYSGQASAGAGCIYVGKGIVSGVDAFGGYYDGTYTPQAGRIQGVVQLTAPHGATLVTGQHLPPGANLQLKIDWPQDFGNGTPQSVSVSGRPVQVSFQKLRDIP